MIETPDLDGPTQRCLVAKIHKFPLLVRFAYILARTLDLTLERTRELRERASELNKPFKIIWFGCSMTGRLAGSMADIVEHRRWRLPKQRTPPPPMMMATKQINKTKTNTPNSSCVAVVQQGGEGQ